MLHAVMSFGAALTLAAQQPPVWRLEQEWRVGGAVDGAHAFDGVRDLKALPSGRIVVLDTKSHQLHILDASGRPLRSAGGRGAGPGEMSSAPRGMAVAPDGRIVVNDPSNGRFSVFSADGRFLRTHTIVRRPAFGISDWAWDAVFDRTGRLIHSVGTGGAVSRGAVPSGPLAAMDSALLAERWSVDLSRSDSALVCGAPPPVHRSPSKYTITGRLSDDGHGGPPAPMVGWMDVPFTQQDPYFARDLDGYEWAPREHGSGELLRRASGRCGEVVARIALSGPRVPIPRAARDSQVRRVPAESQRLVPTVYPWYRALRIDDQNRVWVERDAGGGRRFEVFLASGAPAGIVAVPPALDSRLPVLIAHGRLFGFVRDEDDVPYLVSWRITS